VFPAREDADAALIGRWERLLAAREAVTRVLEPMRAEKTIAASLEARVELRGKPEALDPFREHEAASAVFPGNLANLFIVSEVTLVDDASVEAPYLVRAARAEGGKCERCWTFSRNVGKLAAHPGVCERCADVLQAR
jgi:isoleucyl-tRNA synthetase